MAPFNTRRLQQHAEHLSSDAPPMYNSSHLSLTAQPQRQHTRNLLPRTRPYAHTPTEHTTMRRQHHETPDGEGDESLSSFSSIGGGGGGGFTSAGGGESTPTAGAAENTAHSQEIVNRRTDGSYLLGLGEASTPSVVYGNGPRGFQGGRGAMMLAGGAGQEGDLDGWEGAEIEELDAHYATLARQFFTSGAAAAPTTHHSTRTSAHEEEIDTLRVPMMLRLREQVMQKLEEERWRYEAVG